MREASESDALIRTCHPGCIACRPRAAGGFGLRFELCPDDSVEALFACDPEYQGYPDRLHGGVIALLLDAAMTHWLFLHGVQAVTAKLNVRYHAPVLIGGPVRVRARVVDQSPPLHLLAAELLQGSVVLAGAQAAFVTGRSSKE